MPEQPTPEKLQAIKEMFEASVDGKPYDPARWAFAYRPAGVQKPQDGTTSTVRVPENNTPVTPVTNTVVHEQVTTPVQEAQTSAPSSTEAAPAKESLSAAALVARLKGQGK